MPTLTRHHRWGPLVIGDRECLRRGGHPLGHDLLLPNEGVVGAGRRCRRDPRHSRWCNGERLRPLDCLIRSGIADRAHRCRIGSSGGCGDLFDRCCVRRRAHRLCRRRGRRPRSPGSRHRRGQLSAARFRRRGREDNGLGGRDRRRRYPRRQERGRVDVAVRCLGHPDTQVHIRLRPFGLATRPGAADDIAFCNSHPLCDRDLAEMREGDRVPVETDRHGPTGGRDDTGERHGPRSGSTHRLATGSGDVDTAMLPGRVRILTERIGTEYISPQRPCPGRSRRGHAECSEQCETECNTTHDSPPCFHN